MTYALLAQFHPPKFFDLWQVPSHSIHGHVPPRNWRRWTSNWKHRTRGFVLSDVLRQDLKFSIRLLIFFQNVRTLRKHTSHIE